jgi:uncharacterized protein YmfQ (DUF2313 family)
MAAFPVERDRHIRRTGADYVTAFMRLLPQGIAWPREPDSVLARTCNGLANYWGHVDARAADLLERESDPRKTIELLPDWERAWGLPDPCLAEPLTIADRQRVLVQRMTLLGAQSRQWFSDALDWIHYDIAPESIREYAPFMTGISRCGMTLDASGYRRWEIAEPEIRFYWRVHVDRARLTWFECGSGECGVDPHLIIGLATDLECLLRRWKPAHTDLIFDYSALATGGSMAGTPAEGIEVSPIIVSLFGSSRFVIRTEPDPLSDRSDDLIIDRAGQTIIPR